MYGLYPREEHNSIFVPSPTGGFVLRENIRFHLYINTVTCGDARIFNPNENDDFDDFNIDRASRGILRSKIESGEGTVSYLQMKYDTHLVGHIITQLSMQHH